MIINLDRLDGDTQDIAADDTFPFEDVFGNHRRIHCHTEMHIRRAGETYYLDAGITGYFKTACHNCLEPTDYEVQSSLSLVVRRGATTSNEDPAAGDDDLILLPRGESQLALGQRIYDSLVVDIPMRIACSENCKGLCPGCGVNLNDGKCTCAAPDDPRWDGLRQLRDSLPE